MLEILKSSGGYVITIFQLNTCYSYIFMLVLVGNVSGPNYRTGAQILSSLCTDSATGREESWQIFRTLKQK